MGVHMKSDQSQIAAPKKSPKNQVKQRTDIVKIEILLALEAEARHCTTLKQLQYLIVNDSSKLISARQIIVLSGYNTPSITTISSLATLDKTSPTLRWLEKVLADVLPENSPANTSARSLTLDGKSAPGPDWPFDKAVVVDLVIPKSNNKVRIAFMREKEFEPADLAMAERICDTYAHAWGALEKRAISTISFASKKTMILASLLIAALMFLPVTMSVLAPVEITARDPFIVAAPLTGVIGTIDIDPNTVVKKGDLLFTFTPTDLINELDIARQTVEIARSRFRRASQDAMAAGEGRREMAELKSELDLAQAKNNYALARLEQSKVSAESDGVIIFSDKDNWIGRPVSTGERIMRIADPQNTQFSIKLSVSDSILLENGSQVRVFLDADPLHPVSAKVTQRSFHATADQSGVLTYALIARQTETENAKKDFRHRIGIRGTAQLLGGKVPLALFLFRRPLSAFRQFTGF